MIVDKTENIGEHAWTKLLDDKDCKSNGAVIVKSTSTKTDYNRNNDTNRQQNCSKESSLAGLPPLPLPLPLPLPPSTIMTTTPTMTNTKTTPLNVEQLTMTTSVTSMGAISTSVAQDGVGGDLGGGTTGSAEPLTSNQDGSGGGGGGVGVGLARKESILGTFHRHLRRSIKAVSESPGPITRYRQTRFSSRRVRKRVVFKHGECNVVQGNVAKRRRRYLQDIFTTLVDAQWRWTLLVFAASFLISWALFAFVWWTIAYAHGDLEYMTLKDSHSAENITHTMCVTEVRNMMSAFLYSIETQHTIGYGNRFVTEECPEAIFTMCLQCITGVFIQAFMVGIVFAKLSRPKKRAQTLLFSRNAVICHRDGVPCLMFRVGDMRKSHIIEAHIRAQIIRKKVTKEGEILPFFQQELHIGADGGEDRLMFIWPTTIVHKIDRNSPLYMLSASDMLKERFEVVVMLEGVIESTGMTTQARSSYLPSEILWGHRFVNVVSFRKETGEYEVDYTLFNNTYDVDTPLCSAKQLDELKSEYTRNAKSSLGHALSTGMFNQFNRVASANSVDCLDPASDESLDSGRLQIRSHSIPNGVLASELEPLNNNTGASFTMGGLTITTTAPSIPNLTSINEKTNSGNSINSSNYSGSNNYTYNNNNNNNNNSSTISSSGGGGTGGGNGGGTRSKPNPRRLSIKQDQLPIDSLC